MLSSQDEKEILSSLGVRNILDFLDFTRPDRFSNLSPNFFYFLELYRFKKFVSKISQNSKKKLKGKFEKNSCLRKLKFRQGIFLKKPSDKNQIYFFTSQKWRFLLMGYK